ncbi:MAG: copper resistance protein NlpE N-terminal domain-containing protein [Bacteroidia bacterium]|nr:copper resistance protein NlpE N-terminal domain-containing protein [Bacteroidia bacterium]
MTIACNSSNKSVHVSPSDNHTAETSLDWQGTYSGVLPCADCDGIETDLTLNDDKTFLWISKYIKGSSSLTDTLSGVFTWEKNNQIRLNNIDENERSPLFKVEESQLRYLDKEGQVQQGTLEHFYILTKNGNSEVEDKKWQLVELNGHQVTGSKKTHFIIFNSKEGNAVTKVGCNNITLHYQIKNQFKLELTPGISTMMACPESIEDEYLKVLETVDNLSVGQNRLTLNKGRMAPLAVFELVSE